MEGATVLIGFDTNVLLRFVLEDDPQQYGAARSALASLSAQERGFVPLLVLGDFAWVLARTHKKSRLEITASIDGLLHAATLEIERLDIAVRALQQFRVSKADFTDCCIAVMCAESGCRHTFTFDVAASKLPGMRLLS